MMTERQIQEMIARCVGIMVYYHNCGRGEASSRTMKGEVRAVGDWIIESGLGPDGLERLLFQPVSAELIDRYGYEVGPRLNAVFFAALGGLLPSAGTGGTGMAP